MKRYRLKFQRWLEYQRWLKQQHRHSDLWVYVITVGTVLLALAYTLYEWLRS